jgi:predicted metal-dependent hydrolase
MAEVGRVQAGSAIIDYTVVRSSRRRKTMAIRADIRHGVVVLAPTATPTGWLDDFVRERSRWISERLADAPPARAPRQFATGETLPYLGQEITIVAQLAAVETPRLKLVGRRLSLSVPNVTDGSERRAAVEAALAGWYKRRAGERLRASVERWSAIIGETPRRIVVGDQRSRWGSCAADGTLRFNWRIVMAAPLLMDYVVVHELAHLKQRNHSRAFWAEVEVIMPDYRLRRAQLKEDGQRFDL